MTQHPVVADSSVLISLSRIGRLGLLAQIFTSVIIPPAVAGEVGQALAGLPWADIQAVLPRVDSRIARVSLGPGETDAFGLARQVGAEWLLLDDQPARVLAQSLGIPIVGTLGVLLAAKRRGLIVELRPALEALRDDGFHMSEDMYDSVLKSAEEIV